MKLPLLNAKQMQKLLECIGYQLIRQKGSYMFFRNKSGNTIIIPNHPREKIDSNLLLKIIKKDLKIERDEFIKLCKKIFMF